MITLNGRQVDCSMEDFMRLHFAWDFYIWLNLLRGARGNLHHWSGV